MKDSDKIWDQMRNPSTPIAVVTNPQNRGGGGSLKLMVYLIMFVCATYLVYTLKLLNTPDSACPERDLMFEKSQRTDLLPVAPAVVEPEEKTGLKHIVFGIAASVKVWETRKEFIKLWWKKDSEMRGIVWLDEPVETHPDENLPPQRISAETAQFPYKNKQGDRSALRISRIVSETLRLGMENVRWFVMTDDDTMLITDNLVRVLNKYDHNQFYYIGTSSESHLQNIFFSYNMAYGGGGFAISYPLAVELEKMQDGCIKRYPYLFGSDDRMQACMAELGVPLTKERGFHQFDVYGNLFGLLSAHPVAPLVSLHHLENVEPIFPDMTRVESLKKLMKPMKLDSAGLIQQSICYETTKDWTISVSWGFAIQVIRGYLSPRDVEMPTRTFLNWYRRADYKAYPFNTRPVARNPCQKPFVFYMSKAKLNPSTNQTVTLYTRHNVTHPECRWKYQYDPSILEQVVVYKKPDPQLWDRSPRRNCCRITESREKGLVIDVGICRAGEISG